MGDFNENVVNWRLIGIYVAWRVMDWGRMNGPNHGSPTSGKGKGSPCCFTLNFMDRPKKQVVKYLGAFHK